MGPDDDCDYVAVCASASVIQESGATLPRVVAESFFGVVAGNVGNTKVAVVVGGSVNSAGVVSGGAEYELGFRRNGHQHKLTGLAPVLSAEPGQHRRGAPKVPPNSWLVLALLPSGGVAAHTYPPGSQEAQALEEGGKGAGEHPGPNRTPGSAGVGASGAKTRRRAAGGGQQRQAPGQAAQVARASQRAATPGESGDDADAAAALMIVAGGRPRGSSPQPRRSKAQEDVDQLAEARRRKRMVVEEEARERTARIERRRQQEQQAQQPEDKAAKSRRKRKQHEERPSPAAAADAAKPRRRRQAAEPAGGAQDDRRAGAAEQQHQVQQAAAGSGQAQAAGGAEQQHPQAAGAAGQLAPAGTMQLLVQQQAPELAMPQLGLAWQQMQAFMLRQAAGGLLDPRTALAAAAFGLITPAQGLGVGAHAQAAPAPAHNPPPPQQQAAARHRQLPGSVIRLLGDVFDGAAPHCIAPLKEWMLSQGVTVFEDLQHVDPDEMWEAVPDIPTTLFNKLLAEYEARAWEVHWWSSEKVNVFEFD
ncbi:hypothetical protein CHLNCDRAFT_140404 [Chlorella variabilis]|uniref:Uncharacterized protein n=1 Tax=Chlorella variabilis TaxID=554065 RepID=E1Z6Y6_CHLVA|nr:hypothetical protein CHLNCDRAFT_140404 [Chlorella variabilis]EFN58435.1 hypothetical protein CHLNCDRAFT_140404 [Chlorella variabilis]|eukprot:XP_005850537.1 hypothetical protein CHLNCDRAFT_140404 [Chlorella variabilis]